MLKSRCLRPHLRDFRDRAGLRCARGSVKAERRSRIRTESFEDAVSAGPREVGPNRPSTGEAHTPAGGALPFWREISYQFLEARLASQRIPVGMQAQERGRDRTSVADR